MKESGPRRGPSALGEIALRDRFFHSFSALPGANRTTDGIDRRNDLGCPDRFDVCYRMADDQIGVARLDVPGNAGVTHENQL
jgi:hypothetical protein